MKRALLRPATWPISLKIPLVVAGLMIVIGSLATERVLARLSRIQDQNLREVSGAYLDGLSAAVLPHVLHNDIWEVFDTIERTKADYGSITVVSTIVANSRNGIIAASDPAAFPTGTHIAPELAAAAMPDAAIEVSSDRPVVRVARDIEFQDRIVGRLLVTLDVSGVLVERGEVRLTLVGTNAAVIFILAAFGYFLTRRMTRPMQVLAEHLDQAQTGRFESIPLARHRRSNKEVLALFSSFNSMVAAKNERDQLAASLHEEEKLAGLGRLAAAMAHEINNPLGGMMTALDTLRLHPDNREVQKRTVGLLDRGLKSIRDVVRTSLAAYRTRSESRKLSPKDMADLRHLLRPELHLRSQKLDWETGWDGELGISGTGVRQIGLNLLLNASAAAGNGGRVAFRSDVVGGDLRIVVANDGKGIPEDLLHCLNTRQAKRVPPGDRVGIGLWVICQLVDEMHGDIRAESFADGAAVTVTLPLETGVMTHAA